MSVEFRLPDVGSGIAEAEIVEWQVGVGDQVREGDILVTVETSKSIVEMPSPTAGTVVRLGASPGESLAVGAVLAVLDRPGDEPAAPAATPSASARAARPKASPVVRKIALERGIDLGTVTGTGPGGRITQDDIKSAAAPGSPATAPGQQALVWQPAAPAGQPAGGQPATPPAPPERPAPVGHPMPGWRTTAPWPPQDERVPVRGLRRQVAKKMAESWRTVPHIVDWRDADATQLIEARQALRAARPEQAGSLTFVPFFVKITAVALRQHPLMNASFDEAAEEYTLLGRINIGVATAVPDGVIVPVVRDADRKSVLELAGEIAELVRLARERKVVPGQLVDGSYTVNNLGGIGAQAGTPIIRTPEVGILGFGRITERVVAVGGTPVVRPSVTLSSVADHRLHDGATLGAFTAAVVELIENPYLLLAELR